MLWGVVTFALVLALLDLRSGRVVLFMASFISIVKSCVWAFDFFWSSS